LEKPLDNGIRAVVGRLHDRQAAFFDGSDQSSAANDQDFRSIPASFHGDIRAYLGRGQYIIGYGWKA